MKLDPNCVRDILLEIEKLDFSETTNPDKLHNVLPDYSVEQLTYTCLKLNEGEFLTIYPIELGEYVQPGIKYVIGLTYKGHEFLEKVRPKPAWDKILSASKSVGSFSLEVISKVAVSVLADLLKSQVD